MTLAEFLRAVYGWLDAHALALFAVAVVVPLVGLTAAWLGRGGRTDRDGRLWAEITLGFGLILFFAEVVAIAIAQLAFDASPLDANLLLLLAPVVAIASCLLGVRLVFPLSELGSARTARDVLLFLASIALVVWLFGKFRGWGIVFFGGLFQLLLLAVLLGLLVRFLYRRL